MTYSMTTLLPATDPDARAYILDLGESPNSPGVIELPNSMPAVAVQFHTVNNDAGEFMVTVSRSRDAIGGLVVARNGENEDGSYWHKTDVDETWLTVEALGGQSYAISCCPYDKRLILVEAL